MGSSKYSEKTTKTESLPTIGEKTKVFLFYISLLVNYAKLEF